ncbi:peptidase A2 domain-containing protein [Trichonephila clavipes]|nr:peptidase A2 domain-containing protein [Trichonephila clavipes]
MAYLGKGRREDLFVLATELNLKFDKSMTIATLKDLIIGSENYDEELTKNIHSTIVEDRKAREENLRIEEQKEKLRIEEREEKLRFEQLREPDDKANSYEHVKDLLLKRFKLTPEKFRQLFVTHQKAPERTWIDFYHELNTYFNGWIDGLKIDTFKKLSDLIITDQLKRKTPFEFKEYYLDEWANMNSPVQLAEKLEEFEDFKRTLKQKSSSPFVKK